MLVLVLRSIREEHTGSEERSDELKVLFFQERKTISLQPLLPVIYAVYCRR